MIRRTISSTDAEWPCAVSTTSTSTPASTSASARSERVGADADRGADAQAPCSSFVAFGNSIRFWMSLTVISPLSTPSASTTGSFSILWRCRIASASSSVVPTGAVTRSRDVISAETGCVGVRLEAEVAVRQDADERALGVGDRHAGDVVRAISSSASETSASGGSVTGSTIMPDSERFTLSTSATCASIERLRWTMPMPALPRERDREPRLGDRVHRRRDDRDLERDRARELRRGRDVVREHARLGRDEQDVVERQPFLAELPVELEEPLDLPRL